MQIIRTPSSSSGGGASLPSQGGHAGQYLKTDGSVASWDVVGGGTGFDGMVTTHANLPTALGVPAVGAVYLVRQSSGVWLLSRKQRGLWQRTLNAGSLSDWEYMGEWIEQFSDAVIEVYNAADNSKKLGFDNSGAATGTETTIEAFQTANRTVRLPDRSVTLAGTDEIPAYSDTNPSGTGTAAQGSSPKVSRQDHVHPRQTAITNAEIDAGAAIALSKLATDPLARAGHTGTQTASTISDFNTAVRTNRLDQMAAPTAAVAMNSQKVSGMADGTVSTDAVTKSQLDANATADRARANHTGTQAASTISDFDTQVRTNRLDQMAAPTAAVSANSQKITSLSDPTSAQDAATKSYVDALVNGIAPKESCRAATTANITLSGAQTIDGVSVIAGDRVLVKNQSTASQNGIYVAASGAWSRATDADTSADLISAFCFVEEGSTQADSAWVLTTNGPLTVDTTSLAFVQFGTSATIADGTVTLAKLADLADGTLIGRAVGAGSGVPSTQTFASVIATATHAATDKATPVDADEFSLMDSAASFVLKKLTWANLKATLKTYFDTLYSTVTDPSWLFTIEPGTDDTATGPKTSSKQAGATITQWDVCYLGSAGKWLQADADAASTAEGLLVLSLESKTDTQAMLVALPGSICRNDGWTWSAPGVPLFLSTTAGGITETPPSGTDDVIRCIGWALSDDSIYFNPSADWMTHT